MVIEAARGKFCADALECLEKIEETASARVAAESNTRNLDSSESSDGGDSDRTGISIKGGGEEGILGWFGVGCKRRCSRRNSDAETVGVVGNTEMTKISQGFETNKTVGSSVDYLSAARSVYGISSGGSSSKASSSLSNLVNAAYPSVRNTPNNPKIQDKNPNAEGKTSSSLAVDDTESLLVLHAAKQSLHHAKETLSRAKNGYFCVLYFICALLILERNEILILDDACEVHMRFSSASYSFAAVPLDKWTRATRELIEAYDLQEIREYVRELERMRMLGIGVDEGSGSGWWGSLGSLRNRSGWVGMIFRVIFGIGWVLGWPFRSVRGLVQRVVFSVKWEWMLARRGRKTSILKLLVWSAGVVGVIAVVIVFGKDTLERLGFSGDGLSRVLDATTRNVQDTLQRIRIEMGIGLSRIMVIFDQATTDNSFISTIFGAKKEASILDRVFGR